MHDVSAIAMTMAIASPLWMGIFWAHHAWRPVVVRLAPWAALPALLVSLLVPEGTTFTCEALILGTRLGLDATGRTFLFFTALLWSLGGWFGWNYLAKDPGRDRFFGYFLLAMAGNLGLVLALDAPSFYVCFALMSFASYGLVSHDRNAEALRAGRIYIYLVIVGEVTLFAAFVIITAHVGSAALPVPAGTEIPHLAFGLALAGFGIKAGLLPLHVWLPLAHPVAPTPASAILSGAMIKAGLIGWLRFLPLGQFPQIEWGALLASMGLAAAFLAVLAGITQRNPKTVLAYSSVSQMGIITLGIGAGLLAPENWGALQAAVLLYALHHGLAKGALFLGVGVAGAAGARERSWVGVGLLLPALALAGAPLTSGALAKIALKTSTAALPGAWPGALSVLLPLATVGTTVLMARFLMLTWPRAKGHARLTAGLWLPWGLLIAAGGLVTWVWPATAPFGAEALAPRNLWPTLWPLLAGAAIGVGLWRLSRRGMEPPQVPAGDLLALLEWAVGWWRKRVPRKAFLGAAPVGLPRLSVVGGGRGLSFGPLPQCFGRDVQRLSAAGAMFLLLFALFVWLLTRG
jgi:hydrogenase-4 component B